MKLSVLKKFALAAPIFVGLLHHLPARAANGTWTSLTGGSWANSANWSGGTIAGGTDGSANFNTLTLSANATVTLDGATTIGNLNFDDKNTTKHLWFLTPGSGGPLTLNVSSGSPAITVSNTAVITAVVAGNQGLAKAGGGTLALSAVNTYTGGTTINAGSLIVSNVTALGSDPVQINTNTTLDLSGGTAGYNVANTLLVNGGSLKLFLGSTYSAPITLSNSAATANTFFTTAAGYPVLSGVITGPGGLTVSSSGNSGLAISNPGNNFQGDVTIGTGAKAYFRAYANNAIPSTAMVNINVPSGSGGLGIYNSTGPTVFNETIAGLSGSGDMFGAYTALPAGGVSVLTLGNNAGRNATLAGVVGRSSGGFEIQLVKVGSNVQTLSSVSSYYAEGTSIQGGTLAVSGDGATAGGPGSLGLVPSSVTANSLNLNGGALQATATFTLHANRGIGIGPASGASGGVGTVDVVSGAILTYQGNVASAGNTGANSLVKTDSGTLILGGANDTYNGGTLVSGGTLDVQHDGALGTSNVTVLAGATLKLELGATNGYIRPSANLILTNGAAVNLAFTGANTINALSLDGVGLTYVAAGTWGAVGSSAVHQDSRFAGAGILKVTTGTSSTTTLVSSGSPSLLGQPVTFTATVTGTNATPTGTVTFLDAGVAFSTNTLNSAGVAAVTTSSLALGSQVISANYSGDNNYNPSVSATLTQVVTNTATPILAVTANSFSRVYGNTNLVLTVAYSGFVNGDTTNVLTGAPLVTTAATTNSPVGAYPIAVSAGTLSATNYNFAFVNGTLTVTQATLMVSGVIASNKVYDGTTTAALNTASATLVGVVPGDTVTLNTTGATGTFSDPNIGNNKTVTVTGLTISGASATNYTLVQPALTASITPLNQGGVWTNLAGGSWSVAANWAGGAIAGGSGQTADFSTLSLPSNLTVTLDGAQTIGAILLNDLSGSQHTWTLNTGSGGPLTLDAGANSPAITTGNSPVNLGASLAGTNGFILTGPATFTLNNPGALAGQVLISSGTLALKNTSALGSSPVTVSGGAVLDLTSGVNPTNPVILNGGTVNLLAGSTYGSPVTLGAGNTNYFTTTAVNYSTLTNLITGPGGFTVSSANNSTIQISNPGNNFQGDVVIGTGVKAYLRAGAVNAIPATAFLNISMSSGAGGFGMEDSTGIPRSQTIAGLTGTGDIFGADSQTTTVVSTLTLGNSAGRNASYSGSLGRSGAGGEIQLVKAGSNTQALMNNGSYYAQGTVIQGGILSISGDGATAGAGGSLGYVPTAAKTNNVIINGGVLQATASFTLHANRGLGIGPTNGTTGGVAMIDVTAGNTLVYNGIITGAGNAGANTLVKTDAGALTLGGVNTYNGPTIVSNGWLNLTGTLAGGGPVVVNDGAALSISAASAGEVISNADSLTLGTSSGVALTLSNFTGSVVAPVVVTNLAANGTVTINISGPVAAGQYPLIQYSGSFTGFGALQLGTLPAGVAATLVNDTANHSIDLSVSAYTAPVVSLTSPLNNAIFDLPASIILFASASESGGLVTNVAFYQGSSLLANVASAPYKFTWTNVPVGAYSVTAVATDSNGVSTASSKVSVTVTNPYALATLQQIKTIFIIPLENHDLVQANPTGNPQQLLGNPACPYFNSLITSGNSNSVQTACATHYYSVAINGEHPSEPNYVWSEAGTDFGVRTDNDPTAGNNQWSNVQHLSAQLTAAGIPWRTYQEDMEYSSSEEVSASGSGVAVNPYNGTTDYNYAVKHNPMAFFTDTQNKNCYPLTNFWTDLTNGNIGRYNWITPDQYNEMHSALPGGYTYNGVAYTGDQAAIAEGDNFLSIVIPQIMASQAYQSNGVIIIWTDETESTDDTNTTLPYVIISPLAKGNAYASTLPYSHSSDLKTMDELFGLVFQTNAIPTGDYDAQNDGQYNYVDGRSAPINDLSDFFQSVAPIPLPAPISLAVVPLNASAFVSWNAVSNAASYTLYYDTNSGGPYGQSQNITSGTVTTVSNLVNNVPYYFVVAALDTNANQGALSAQVSATPALATTNHPYVGVTCIASTVTYPRLLKINVVDIDLSAPGLRFHLTGPSGPLQTISQPTLNYLTNLNCQVAVNANFFSVVNGNTPTPENLIGLAASDGDVFGSFYTGSQTIASFSSPFPGLNIDPSNHVSIVHPNPADPTGLTPLEPVMLWNAVGAPQIITNGVAMTSISGDSLNPRTGIGFTANNHLIIMTIDGRAENSGGVYIAEMAAILQTNYGVYNALNLDGGGSTTLAIASPAPHIANQPSDNPPRADGDNLGVFAVKAYIAIAGVNNGSTLVAPTNVVLNASVMDVAGNVTNVTYYQNGVSLGAASSSPYNVVWTNPPVGGYALTAVATDDSGLSVTSTVLNITVSSPVILPPVIVSQPASVTNYAGTTASFNVGATAATQLFYQWYFGTNVLAGQTNSVLSLASVGPTNVGSYYVVVNNAGGSTNSDPASLTVIYQAPNVVGGQMMLGANGFQLTFSGPVGQTYEVLASDDLFVPQSAWTVLGTGTFGGANASFTDPDAVNHPGRFYVIKSP